MLNLHMWTTNNKLFKQRSLDKLEEEIKKEVLFRNERYKAWLKEKYFEKDPDYFRSYANCVKFEEEIRRNLRELRQGLEFLSVTLSSAPISLASYPEETIKHPKDVLNFIKKSIAKKEVTDNILTFDPTVYKLIEARYIDDKRVCVYINGIKRDSSLKTINKALEVCTKPFYQLYMNSLHRKHDD